MEKKIAIFPGSFDPFTLGHEDIARRGAEIFDELVVSIGINSAKSRYVPVEKMKDIISKSLIDLPNVKVETYQELTSSFAKKIGAKYILRGLRNTTDFEYENTIAQVNNYLNDELETVYLITEPKLAFISSSIVREIHKFGGDVSSFLSY
ncbi:MAG: pantetheine-phosphate adenylyltransferase, partial [Cytophagales bacterium]